MNDKQLFNEVLERFQQQYDFEVEHPYNDGYIEIVKDGEIIGGMNTDGYNLLYNLTRLCRTLKDELA